MLLQLKRLISDGELKIGTYDVKKIRPTTLGVQTIGCRMEGTDKTTNYAGPSRRLFCLSFGLFAQFAQEQINVGK